VVLVVTLILAHDLGQIRFNSALSIGSDVVTELKRTCRAIAAVSSWESVEGRI